MLLVKHNTNNGTINNITTITERTSLKPEAGIADNKNNEIQIINFGIIIF